MENLKIKVNNEAESGEAQALLLKSGYKLERLNKYEYPQYVAFNPAEMTFKNYVMDAYVPLLWKEITLSALRDMLEPQHKENLKIHVKNEAESKEAQELFFKLGYGWFEERSHEFNGLNARYLLTKSRGTLHYTKEYIIFALLEIKEITSQELRAMATPKHKEYLDPHNNYELIEWDGVFMVQDHWIEVPAYANFAEYDDMREELYFSPIHLPFGHTVWQRDTQPEELPFIDDRSKVKRETHSVGICIPRVKPNSLESLKKNGFIESFPIGTQFIDDEPKHSHYFKDVSDVDIIDVYDVLLRFGVTDPCLQHIVKKALCAGDRGHKDFHQDLKEIADTAQRALVIHGAQ